MRYVQSKKNPRTLNPHSGM
uniref:Uncharacterized protein n=1 Tax=Rhizophora mucronata TaxID=61149 RepID=A0A2P2PCZ8_RHIMU